MTKNRPLFLSLAGCAGICLLLRIVLKLTAIDPATGFYEGGGALPLLFNVLLGASVLLLLALGFLSGRKLRGASVAFTLPLRALSAAAGAALFCWTLLRLGELPGVLSADYPFMPKLLLCLFTLLFRLALPLVGACLFVRIAGAGDFTIPCGFRAFAADPDSALSDPHSGPGPRTLRMNGWLMLLPLVWEIGELLSSFMAYTAIRNVSDQMLTIVMMILMAPFLLAHARILSGVGVEKGLRQLLFFGPAFALFAIAVPGGMIAAALAGKTVALGLSPVSAVFYFLSGLYAAVLCLSLRRFAR